jgi:hypothetical protein
MQAWIIDEYEATFSGFPTTKKKRGDFLIFLIFAYRLNKLVLVVVKNRL